MLQSKIFVTPEKTNRMLVKLTYITMPQKMTSLFLESLKYISLLEKQDERTVGGLSLVITQPMNTQ